MYLHSLRIEMPQGEYIFFVCRRLLDFKDDDLYKGGTRKHRSQNQKKNCNNGTQCIIIKKTYPPFTLGVFTLQGGSPDHEVRFWSASHLVVIICEHHHLQRQQVLVLVQHISKR